MAQSNVGINTIVEVKEDRSRGSATIVTSGKKPLPRPIIQFLSAENGNTVLVADFNEVVFPFSTKVISVHASPLASSATTNSAGHDGIKLVRIGRFQENPPVTRIAIVSGDPEKLKAVTFDARPGTLSIRWPRGGSPKSLLPPVAPSLKHQAGIPRHSSYSSNFSPPAAQLDPGTIDMPQAAYPQSRLDAQVAGSNSLGLRPEIQEPVIASRPNHAQSYSDRNPKKSEELLAKAQSLPYANSQKAPPLAPPIASSMSAKNTTPAKSNSNKSAIASAPVKPIAVAPQETGESKGTFSNLISKVKDRAKTLIATSTGETQESAEDLKESPKKTVTGEPESAKKIEDQTKQPSNENTGAENQIAPQPNGQPPTVTLSPNQSRGYTVKVTSPDKSDLNFTSFRLHNPERFVVDFQNLASMVATAVPQPESSDHLKAIRVGAPDPAKGTGRLVFDLAAENVSVIPGDTGSVNEVSFVIGETTDPLVGLTPPPGSVLVLDAGHGGSDPGAQRGFIKEKELTLSIAEKTRKKLVDNGVKVIMTRTDDTFVSLPDRVSITNTNKPDAFLSVHINSLESTSDIHGIETYYQSDMSRGLAQTIHESLVSELQAPNRSVRKAKFYVVNRAEVPAVLAEVGFISNKAERDKLVSEDYQEKIAGALAKGAILYLKQHSAVAGAGKVSRASESKDADVVRRDESSKSTETNQVGSTIPRAKQLVHKGLGIKSE